MAKFVVGTPVVTNTPLVEVTADPAQLLSADAIAFNWS